jgi:hypothetical protein
MATSTYVGDGLHNHTRRTPGAVWRGLCLGLTGACVGCLAGLSASPVVGIVLTSVTAVLAALTSAIAGLDVRQASTRPNGPSSETLARIDVSPAPVLLLMIGVLLGSMAGIWIRTHDWLGTVGTDTNSSTALGTAKGPAPPALSRFGVLYGGDATVCEDLRATDRPGNEDAFRARLGKAVDVSPDMRSLVNGCRDRSCLQALTRLLCP